MGSAPELQPGTALGRYQVLRELGRGSTAAVYLARPARDPDARVAIKVRERGDSRLDRRFLREVSSLRDLHLPGVARLHEAGASRKYLWFAMDVVHGTPLRRWVHQRGDVAERVAAALDVGGQLFSALAQVHDRGLVHRDLKSSNVLVDADGRVHLLDFGVVGWWGHGGTLTGRGRLVGTMPYMSPEQVAGLPVSGASDVFGGALLLYEGIRGPRRRPRTPRDWLTIQVIEAPPSLAAWDLAVPRDLSGLIDEMLAFDPADRPPAAEVAARLSRLRHGGTSVGGWPRPPRMRGRSGLPEALLRRLVGEGPLVTVLVGPAGSGRRRAAEAARRLAVLYGGRSLRGRCRQDDPGGAAGQLVRTLLQAPSDPGGDAVREGPADDVAPLIEMWPDLPLQRGADAHAAPVTAWRLADAVAAALARAAADRPLLLVIEDLDQVDPLTARTLESLARLAPEGLAVVGVLDDRWRQERANKLLSRLQSLGVLELHRMLDLEAAATAQLAADLVPADVPRSTAGAASPQRAAELARLDLARWRGETLPPLTAELVPLAVLEEPAPRALITALGIDSHAAQAAGLLREGPPGYLQLAGERARREAEACLGDRQAAADTLADCAAGLEWDGAAAWEARHRLHGARPDRALLPAMRAALAAVRDHDLAAARRWLMVVDGLPRPRGDQAYADLRFALSVCRAEVSLRTDTARLRTDLVAQARGRARTASERVHAGLLHAMLLRREGAFEAAATTCEDAVRQLGSAEPELALRAHLLQTAVHLDARDHGRSARALDQADHLRRRLDDDITDLEVGVARAELLLAMGTPGAAVERCRSAIAQANMAGWPQVEAELLGILGQALLELGQRGAAEGVLAQARRRLLAQGELVEAARAGLALGWLVLARGDAAAAEVRCVEVLQVAEPLARPRLTADAHALAIEAARCAGDRRAARADRLGRALTAALRSTRGDGLLRACWVRWLRHQARPNDALALSRLASRPSFGTTWTAIATARCALDLGLLSQAMELASSAQVQAEERGFVELQLLAELVAAASTGVRPDIWESLLERVHRTTWRELELASLELGMLRHHTRAEREAERRAARQLNSRAQSLGDDGYSRSAQRQLAALDVTP